MSEVVENHNNRDVASVVLVLLTLLNLKVLLQ